MFKFVFCDNNKCIIFLLLFVVEEWRVFIFFLLFEFIWIFLFKSVEIIDKFFCLVFSNSLLIWGFIF